MSECALLSEVPLRVRVAVCTKEKGGEAVKREEGRKRIKGGREKKQVKRRVQEEERMAVKIWR